MRISSPRLRRLDDALAALPADSDAMLLSELDGYVAGLIVCPDLILPGEWLPRVWSSDGGGSPFADEREAQWYLGLVMDHYNAVVRTLGKDQGRYVPFLEVDDRHDEILWELWVEGFEAAMRLRPDSWARIAETGDEPAAAALAGMIVLAEIAHDESDLERAAIDALTRDAPDLIARWVPTLNAWRVDHRAASSPRIDLPRPGKVGRNEACPCGSGRKHKKCCGLN